MNSPSKYSSLDGQESVSGLSEENISGADRKSADTADNMKRAATQLIQQYYYQLTNGCGNKDCSNDTCASSPSFHFANIDCNKLAIEALALFKSKAPLCDRSPSKLSRVAIKKEGGDGPSTSETASTSGVLGAKSKASCSSTSVSGNVCGSSSAGRGEQVCEFFTEQKLNDLIEQCEESKSWKELIKAIGYVFSQPESIAASFCKPVEESNSLPREEASSSSLSNSDSVENISLVGSSVDPEPVTPSPPLITVDIPSLRRSYQRLMNVPEQLFQGALINALGSLSQTLELQLKYRSNHNKDSSYYLNIFVILMENPMLHSPEFLDSAFPAVCRALSNLPLSEQAKLVKIWSEYSKEEMLSLVQALQQMITVKVISNEGRWSSDYSLCDDSGVTSSTCVLKILYYASVLGGGLDSPELLRREKEWNDAESLSMEPKDSSPPREDLLAKECGIRAIDCQRPLIPPEDFINEPLNDNLDIELDYINYRAKSKFSFVPYSFILTTASKHNSMYFDSRIHMLQERRTAFVMQTLVHGGPPNPFFRVRVRRDHIVDDALVNLEMVASDNPSDLRKQLFVEFDGEQGLDEGGVSKEFFQLIVEELFNPDIGMFIYNEESHHFWFSSQSFENDGQFTLIGILLGLAIYNSCILDIHFPMIVYRKLLGKIGTFQDLIDVDPTLMNSLQDMLDYEGDDFVDVFDQTFRIGYKDVFGTSLTHDLKEDGDKIAVTHDNKREFVDLYADYLLNKSIERQFRAFKRGFLMVTSESPLKMLFRPDELEVLVCGSKIFDFHALENATEYDGGFTQDSPTIRNFWLVVHKMSEVDQRKLLQFTTGTDRVPVGGLSKLKMIIARNGPDSERLPTAHTCFNVLLLPEYPTVEKMHDRLTKAINYSKGFGML